MTTRGDDGTRLKMTGTSGDDLTGKVHMVQNVASGWVAHFVVIIAGFVVPRMISDTQGVVLLGVWDFGWATARYLSMAKIGLTQTMGRYTALYRASGDHRSFSNMFSAILVWQLLISVGALCVVGVALIGAPHVVSLELAPYLSEIRWVGGLLALGIIIEMTAGPARGILIGHHRWAMNNTLNAISDASCAIGMVAVLAFGGGLRGLAIVSVVVIATVEIIRIFAASRYISKIKISIIAARSRAALDAVTFGLKSSFIVIPQLLITQTAYILLAHYCGAAALAVFARPMSLIIQINTIVNKFSFVIMPMASSLVGMGAMDDLRKMFVWSSKTALFIGAPFLSVLAVNGDLILLYWMGEHFSDSFVPLVLAMGAILPTSMTAGLRVLIGMDAHGRLGLYSLAVALIVFGGLYISYVILIGFSPDSTAVIVALSLTCSLGVTIMVYGCASLGIRVGAFVLQALAMPTAVFAGMALFQYAARAIWHDLPLVGFLMGLTVSGLAYVSSLWLFALNDEQRGRIRIWLSSVTS